MSCGRCGTTMSLSSCRAPWWTRLPMSSGQPHASPPRLRRSCLNARWRASRNNSTRFTRVERTSFVSIRIWEAMEPRCCCLATTSCWRPGRSSIISSGSLTLRGARGSMPETVRVWTEHGCTLRPYNSACNLRLEPAFRPRISGFPSILGFPIGLRTRFERHSSLTNVGRFRSI